MNGEISSSIMCRACMKVDGVLLPMYGDYTISKKNFPDKLADLASIQIDKYDGLPSVLCAKCAYRTEAFYEFKLQVRATETKLRQMFQCPRKQDTLLKSQDVKNNLFVEGDDYLIEVPIETKYLETSEVLVNLNEDEKAAKTVATENSDDDLAFPGSLDFVEKEDKKNIFENNFAHSQEISLPETIYDDSENRQMSKGELSHDMKEILHTENMNYALLYVSDDNEIDTDGPRSEITITNDSDGISRGETSKLTFLNETSSEETPEGCSEISRITFDPNDLENPEKTSISTKPSKKTENSVLKDATAPIESRKTFRCKNAARTLNSEDSESDYSMDPEDNLLGSLNDTITRIKEIKTEGGRTIFQCTLCVENYDKLTDILSHTVDTHVPKGGPFFCVVCEKDCSSHKELRGHVKSHSGKYPYTCFVCNKAYSMKRYLKRHMSCHTDLPRHRCPKCGERFNVKSDLETHLNTHAYTGPPFTCNQCPRVFNHKGNYKRHLISHLDPNGIQLPKYPCEICGKRFLNNRTLQTHIRVHTGEKPYECDICKRSFSQRGNLLNHQRIHYNPRSYTCEVCGKRFNQRATLRDHSLLHTGEKPYVCNVCGIAFTFSAALRRHMWSHASDKPFGCEICNARFVGKYDIKRHMKIHTERPKTKRKNRIIKEDPSDDFTRNEIVVNEDEIEENDKIFIQEVLLIEDSTEIAQRQEEAEKENVDVLLNLIEYG